MFLMWEKRPHAHQMLSSTPQCGLHSCITGPSLGPSRQQGSSWEWFQKQAERHFQRETSCFRADTADVSLYLTQNSNPCNPCGANTEAQSAVAALQFSATPLHQFYFGYCDLVSARQASMQRKWLAPFCFTAVLCGNSPPRASLPPGHCVF